MSDDEEYEYEYDDDEMDDEGTVNSLIMAHRRDTFEDPPVYNTNSPYLNDHDNSISQSQASNIQTRKKRPMMQR